MLKYYKNLQSTIWRSNNAEILQKLIMLQSTIWRSNNAEISSVNNMEI